VVILVPELGGFPDEEDISVTPEPVEVCMLWFRLCFICIFTFGILFFVSSGYAEFEGYWLQTSVTESDMPIAGKGRETTEQKIFFKPGMMKIVDIGSGEMTIIRMDKEIMWQVNTEDSTYTEMTFAEMEKASAETKERIAKAKSEMAEEMKNMSPEERKMMEKFMGSKMAAMMGAEEETVQLSLKSTDKKDIIGDYECKLVVMTLNEEPFVNMWVTDKYDVGGELFNFYRKMNVFQYEPTKEMKTFKGFPVKMESTMDMGMGAVTNTTTVSKVVETSLKGSEFELPKGLKKQVNKTARPE
jgi:hypothetical protein